MTVVRHLYFDGKIQKASSGETFESIDPSNSQSIATVHKASESDIDAAIASARAAFHPWASTSTTDRSQILLRAVALLRQRNDEIARQETTDTGKPFSETSTVDVVTGTDTLEFYANLIASGGLDGETVRLRRDAWFYSRNEPLGVCAGIGAWNYPVSSYGQSLSSQILTASRFRSHSGNQLRVWPPATRWCTSRASSRLCMLRH